MIYTRLFVPQASQNSPDRRVKSDILPAILSMQGVCGMEVNMNKVLVVVDMQNDFISGSLGTKEAEAIVPAVIEKIKEYRQRGARVVYTYDTHGEDYPETQEGKNLPVEHCIRGTWGWELPEEIAGLAEGADKYEKPTFGSKELIQDLARWNPEEIEFVGLCTDICVVSNVLGTKAWLPETPITVDSSCCAGVTPESHRAALDTMRSCQVRIV